MRDIARRADVGQATLFRHFPTREALFEVLLRSRAEALVQQAAALEASSGPDEALLAWFPDAVAFTHHYGGICELLAAAHADPDSALHAASLALHAAGDRLLRRAQAEGTARGDLDGVALFAMFSSLGWLHDQPVFVARADLLVSVMAQALFQAQAAR